MIIPIEFTNRDGKVIIPSHFLLVLLYQVNIS